MYDIALLHTLEGQAEAFKQLAEAHAPRLNIYHAVYPDLLKRAQQNGMDSDLRRDIQLAMHETSENCHGPVICTCSSIGGAAELAGKTYGFVSHRIDRPMADRAVRSAESIVIVAALKSTLKPTLDLLQNSASNLGKQPSIRQLVADGAWTFFEKGQINDYHQLIAKTIQNEIKDPAELVVLAQASMAGAAALVDAPNDILSSPALGFKTYIAQYFPKDLVD